MIVRPELISASSAPRARPLKNCDPNWDQEMDMKKSAPRTVQGPRRRLLWRQMLSIVTQVAAKRIRLLHERRAGHDLEHVPEVFLVLHVGRLLALHDDHRTHELVVFLAEVHLAHRRLDLAARL